MNIHIPPLRERVEDIPLLAHHFLQKYVQKNRKDLKGFTPAAMDMLTRAKWSGNVRELENVIERAVILAVSPYLSEKDLPPSMSVESQTSNENRPVFDLGGKSLEEIESQAISETLEHTQGNKSEAAKLLNITRTTLNSKLKKYNLTR